MPTPNLHLIQQIYHGLKVSPPPNQHAWRLRLFWLVGEYLNGIETQKTAQYFAMHTALRKILPAEKWKDRFPLCLRFYNSFPDWYLVDATLSWTHYLLLSGLTTPTMRFFYQQEAILNHWSTRQLQRQIGTNYFQRTIAPTSLPYMQGAPPETVPAPKALLKRRYIFEFLAEHPALVLDEKALEQALLDHLQSFLLELGRGFAFVSRQQRIATETGKAFYIDLVFYHFVMKRFVLFELKTAALSHQAIGQLDLYLRLFDAKCKRPDDLPTLGIILCPEQDGSLLKYSLVDGHQHLFVALYNNELPPKDPLRNLVDWDWIDQVLKQNRYTYALPDLL
ncbi:MAG: PDDEXK nuclease domain-containing protein [Saprospiraceae bacterium]